MSNCNLAQSDRLICSYQGRKEAADKQGHGNISKILYLTKVNT